jgi:hypothetical protein
MKPKEYVKKYHLEETVYFDRNKFIDDILDDFKAMLGSYPKLNTTIFQNCINNIEVKFNNIFANTQVTVEARDKFWKYFFAACIIPIRNIYFPDWGDAVLQHRLKTDKDFARRYECYQMHKEMEDFERKFYRNMWEEAFRERQEEFMKMLGLHQNMQYVHDACAFMGIQFNELTADVLKTRYRQLAKMTHPDVDVSIQSHDQFVSLSNAKEILEKYLNVK